MAAASPVLPEAEACVGEPAEDPEPPAQAGRKRRGRAPPKAKPEPKRQRAGTRVAKVAAAAGGQEEPDAQVAAEKQTEAPPPRRGRSKAAAVQPAASEAAQQVAPDGCQEDRVEAAQPQGRARKGGAGSKAATAAAARERGKKRVDAPATNAQASPAKPVALAPSPGGNSKHLSPSTTLAVDADHPPAMPQQAAVGRIEDGGPSTPVGMPQPSAAVALAAAGAGSDGAPAQAGAQPTGTSPTSFGRFPEETMDDDVPTALPPPEQAPVGSSAALVQPPQAIAAATTPSNSMGARSGDRTAVDCPKFSDGSPAGAPAPGGLPPSADAAAAVCTPTGAAPDSAAPRVLRSGSVRAAASSKSRLGNPPLAVADADASPAAAASGGSGWRTAAGCGPLLCDAITPA